MKLVLDQELQKYNNLIDIMNDTLKAALNVIDGKSLINDKIEAFIDSLEAGDIPDVWMDAAYPTMDDLNGFLDDLKKRTEFLRDWQVQLGTSKYILNSKIRLYDIVDLLLRTSIYFQLTGPPKAYWLTALFEPGDFLIAIMYMSAIECGKSFHELALECR